MPLLDVEVPRLRHAREMTDVARDLFTTGRVASAFMLYIPALEMVGWELHSQLGLEQIIAKRFGKNRGCYHRLRHFSAAAAYFASVMLNNPNGIAERLDFHQVKFEMVRRPGNPCPGSDAKPIFGPNADIIRDLLSLISLNFRHPALTATTAEGEPLRQARAAVAFLSRASMGFLENQRMALIHQDNDFEFTTHMLDGTVISSRTFDLQSACEVCSQALDWIWHSLPVESVVAFLDKHLPSMFEAFESVLLHNSYARTAK